MVAKRPVKTVTHRPVQGDRAGTFNEPPPSTYAAQLVQTHAPDNRNVDQDDIGQFRQMLHAILYSDDIPPETNPEVNYKVIHCVVQLGLDTISADDPFAQWDTLLAQAKDSIAVISDAIRRQPVLLSVRHGQDQDQLDDLPMVVWLVIRLLRAASQPKCNALFSEVTYLLANIVQSLAKSLDHWRLSELIQSLYQDSVEEILAAFSDTPQARSTLKVRAQLPPTRSISRLSPSSSIAAALSPQTQLTLDSAASLLQTAGLLLASVLKVHTEKYQTANDRSISSSLSKWLHDQMLLLNKALFRSRGMFSSESSFNDCVSRSLGLIFNSNFSSPSASLTRPPSGLFQCILLNIGACLKQPFPETVQAQLAELLERVTNSPASQSLSWPRHFSDLLAATAKDPPGLSGRLQSILQSITHAQQALNGVNGPGAFAQSHDVQMQDAEAAEPTDRALRHGHATVRRTRTTMASRGSGTPTNNLYIRLISKLRTIFGNGGKADERSFPSVTGRV